jgi:hypothetical protein
MVRDIATVYDIADSVLEREATAAAIKELLATFHDKIADLNFKKGIYLYGASGAGKTYFIKRLLREIGYDMIYYSAADVRNKTMIENIASNNMASHNVLQMMYRRKQKIAVVMDEIDCMNNGDKGSITALIKLIRQKKTKKQKQENQTLNPIICIGNYYVDKKIKELMKVCHLFEIKTPTVAQIGTILREHGVDAGLLPILESYIQGDLRKLTFVFKVAIQRPALFAGGGGAGAEAFRRMFQGKTNTYDSKKITHQLIQQYIPMEQHSLIMNETERTIVALLWHENIIDVLAEAAAQPQNVLKVYLSILDKICFADYIDRITFQNQIWQFNVMSSLIKTFYSNLLFHDFLKTVKPSPLPLREIRFTKVLTKYSTEYNNSVFIFNLCNLLEMDKKDVLALFQELRRGGIARESLPAAISDLDIKRVYRFLDKNVKRGDAAEPDGDDDLDELWEPGGGGLLANVPLE